MKFYALILTICFWPFVSAAAGALSSETSGHARALGGFSQIAHSDRADENKYHFPAHAGINQKIAYEHTPELKIELEAAVQGQSGVNLDNLNQGHWGEEIALRIYSEYGDVAFGQMPNVATELGINKPNFATWQPLPTDIVNFIENPNWRQRKKNKFYSTLDSTLINTDASALKLSYLTPEYLNTTLGISYIPENNANDGLTSKYAPYANKDAYVAVLYNHQEFTVADAEFYLSFADYRDDHKEYASGLSLYRKGWTAFGSYRQTEISDHDKPILKHSTSENTLVGFDLYRQGNAFNVGLGYEWAVFNSTISYFAAEAKNSKAHSRIVNWHNSIKPHKNFTFYTGAAWVDFLPAEDNIASGKRGLAVYAGVEYNF